MVGRGIVRSKGPVIVRLYGMRRPPALVVYGPVQPGGYKIISKVKLGGLSTHCGLLYGRSVIVRGRSSGFAMGVPLLS